MNLANDIAKTLNRRTFLKRSTTSLGAVALGMLLNQRLFGGSTAAASPNLHFAPRAKRVIYMFMSGAPSHIDPLDYTPRLKELTGTELPDSIRMGQRITGMTSGQKQLLCVGSPFSFTKHGKSG